MNHADNSMEFRATLAALAGLAALSLASCDSAPPNQGAGGSSSVGGSNGASGGTTAITVTTTPAGGSTQVGATAVGGTSATGETTAVGGASAAGGSSTTSGTGTAPPPLSWSFTSDTEGWAAANSSTLTYYTGSDTFCSAGCVELTGDLTSSGASYNARFVFSQPLDLSGGASISASVKYIVPTGSNDFGTIAIYAQDTESVVTGDDNWANGTPRGNKSTAGGLADPVGATLQFNLPASKVSADTELTSGGTAKQGFNPALIHLIGLVVVSGDASQVGTTTFLVDSITITKP